MSKMGSDRRSLVLVQAQVVPWPRVRPCAANKSTAAREHKHSSQRMVGETQHAKIQLRRKGCAVHGNEHPKEPATEKTDCL